MTEHVQKLRQVLTAKVTGFDRQLWPINCVILILIGCVAGIVIAVSDFHDPRILYNSWARLISVGAIMGLLFWGVARLQGRMSRRLQLCILVGVLFHVWLAVYLYEQYVAAASPLGAESGPQAAEPYPMITVPDYHRKRIGEPEKQQAFETPVESEAPKPRDLEVIKRETNDPAIPTEVAAPGQFDIPERQQPYPAVTRRAELSAGRRADAPAGMQISRQQWAPSRIAPNEPIPEPEIKSQPSQAAAVPMANIAPQQRQRTGAPERVRQIAGPMPAPTAPKAGTHATRQRRFEQEPVAADAIPARLTPLVRSSPGVNLLSNAMSVEAQPASISATGSGTPASRLTVASNAANPRAAAQPASGRSVAEGVGVGMPTRREGGLPVGIAATAGLGGLGYDPSPQPRLPIRRARPESEIIHTVSRQFVFHRSGGGLAIDGRVREQPTEAFRRRDLGRRAQATRAFGGSDGTEKAVEMGLDFFARHQFTDGHWSLHELPPGLEYEDPALGEMQADAAATGLALLTYLGAGHTHLEGKHQAVVNRGIDWLLRNQKPNGELFTGASKFTRFYSHGIAAIALCEAYGMTRDPGLREPARKAIEFIVHAQHPTQGGWRYLVDEHGVSTETDTSVSGWQLMALKSAQMAGLEVPHQTLQKVDAWLDTAQAASVHGQSAAGRYVYNPHAKNIYPRQRDGRKPSLAMTAEAMLMRMYLGHPSDDPSLIAGAKHLKQNLPQVSVERTSDRNCYYWYYATQAMFQMQDDYWKAWNDRLRPLAQQSQIQVGEPAGSWHPARPVPDRWGHAGGRHYVTALHVLMLEVYYRHLPLFQELHK